jgi:hypothetical protein
MPIAAKWRQIFNFIIMRTNKFLRNVIVMSTLLAVSTVFSGCDKNDDPEPGETIVVESISLNNSTLTIAIGETATLVATTDPANAKVIWTSDNANTVVDDSGKVTGKAEGTAVISATAGDKIATCTVIVRGALINGVVWALRNVDVVGAFAEKPESTGKFYQWNRKKAWNTETTGVFSGDWDITPPTGAEWTKANDPSPAGWRVPTFAQMQKLLDNNKVTRAWTALNGVNGFRFTDNANGASIFLPAVGYVECNGTIISESVGTRGEYFSGTVADAVNNFVYGTYFNEVDAGINEYGYGCYGQSVRSVLE